MLLRIDRSQHFGSHDDRDGVSNTAHLRAAYWALTANGAVNVNLQSHTTTAIATGLHYLTQYAPAGGAWCPGGIFATLPGEGLDINLSGNVAVGGELTYVLF